MSETNKPTEPVIETTKNHVDGSDLVSGGDMNIGDKTTINFYGHEANQKDLEFFIKVYVILILIFGIAFIVFLAYPQKEDFPNDYITSFVAGGFFALGSLFLLLLFNKKNSAIDRINKTKINEIQN